MQRSAGAPPQGWTRRALPVAPSELLGAPSQGGSRDVRRLLERHELVMKAHLLQVSNLLEDRALAPAAVAGPSAPGGAHKRAADADADADGATRKAARGESGAWTGLGSDLCDLRDELRRFAAERDWDQFHTPRNLALALTGEVGELCECFQWKGDAACEPGLPEWEESKRDHLGDELSDCLLYLVRLADKCGVDLPAAAARKLARNAAKYPAALVRGSARKYTEYETGRVAAERRGS